MIRKIFVDDAFQSCSYELVEAEGENFSSNFEPGLSPTQMLELGVFGGVYFQGEIDEFPLEWFAQAKTSSEYDRSLNYFAIDASQSREVWLKNGWINAQDPRGWFQWYCRYYYGRRSDDDERQIKRWRQMARHAGQIKANCYPGDELCRRKQRQALLHWAYDSRKL